MSAFRYFLQELDFCYIRFLIQTTSSAFRTSNQLAPMLNFHSPPKLRLSQINAKQHCDNFKITQKIVAPKCAAFTYEAEGYKSHEKRCSARTYSAYGIFADGSISLSGVRLDRSASAVCAETEQTKMTLNEEAFYFTLRKLESFCLRVYDCHAVAQKQSLISVVTRCYVTSSNLF